MEILRDFSRMRVSLYFSDEEVGHEKGQHEEGCHEGDDEAQGRSALSVIDAVLFSNDKKHN